MPEDSDPFVGKITQKALLFGPDDEVLLTRSDDHWQPPGGTFECGETLVGELRREPREEVAIDPRGGPLVEAIYGGWIDEKTGEPMVTIVYRCETDEAFPRLDRAVNRAAAFDGMIPFAAVSDPCAATDMGSKSVLKHLAAYRDHTVPSTEPDDENEV